jgi:hypothetical protein
MKIKVITPAGCIYVSSFIEAKEYNILYGYPFVVIKDEKEEKDDK